MKIFARYLLAYLGLALTFPLFASEEVILQRGDIAVTVNDVHRYILSNTPEKDRTSILAKKNAFKGIIENIYIFRSLEKEAKQNSNLDWAQINWSAEMQKTRIIALALLKNEGRLATDGHNWEPVAREVYLVEGERFSTPEMVRASHVLIKIEGRTKSEAKSLIQEARKQALNGEDFKKVVARYSEDPSAKSNKGDLGFFKRGQMAKPFEEAAFSMKKQGDISEIIETKFGFHIIKFKKHRAASKRPFDSVKEEIIEQLKSAKRNQLRQDRFIKLRSEAAVSMDKAKLEPLKEKYRPH